MQKSTKRVIHRLLFMKPFTFSLVAGCLLALTTTAAFGWGQEGHQIVADIAEKYLNAKARADFKQLLPNQSLADVANYADVYRLTDSSSAPWHYVDIPLSATNYDAERDCVAHHGCLIQQLEIFKKQLADPNESQSNRVFALKFVVHLVGDLHQPLHCEDNQDKGGNQVKVTFFGGTNQSPTSSVQWNLHSVWDTGLIKHTGLDESNYVQFLIAHLDAQAILAMQTGTTIDWALQSHRNAAEFAYKLPANNNLDEAYFKMVKPVLDASLLRGGVRLARVLNEALGK